MGRVLALVFGILALTVAAAEARPYRLAWDRNTDSLTTGYRVYYGTASGAYQLANGTDVGNALEFTADLTPGVTYFFVVRAYSASTLGPPSAELRFTVPVGASISVNTASVAPGATITATVTGGPGNRLDWVGLFPTGAPSTGSTDWKYLNGSRTAPATGVTSATVSFVAPSTLGTYAVRFYSSSNTLLASSITISVNGTPTISATSTVSTGQTIAVAVRNGPANRYDMVALYPSSSTSTSAYIDWKYLNGSQVAPTTGTANANLTFTAPAQAGQYVVRFLANNGASVLATSGIITVTTTTAVSVTPNVSTLVAGSSLIAQVRNGPAGRYDWVGLFAVGASNGAAVARYYLNGTLSVPATGLASANVTFIAPQQAGQYNLRFFPNNGTTPTATSGTITVTAPTTSTSTAPTVTPSITSVLPDGNVTAQVRNGPATPLDWVALYSSGASDSVFIDWFYLNGSKAAPSTGVASANVVFRMPTTAGKYFFRLFKNNSYSMLSTSTTVNVSSSATSSGTTTSTSPRITPSATTVSADSLITVTVANGTGLRLDWVALYAAGQSGANFLDWAYLNGQKIAPVTGVANTSFAFRVPSTPGTYVLRFYTNNSYTVLASSVNIFVQ